MQMAGVLFNKNVFLISLGNDDKVGFPNSEDVSGFQMETLSCFYSAQGVCFGFVFGV